MMGYRCEEKDKENTGESEQLECRRQKYTVGLKESERDELEEKIEK